jgi:hypothetical protein
MAGFLGLGGGKGSFFLDSDDAKSFGDIEYMRSSKKVKRSFPSTKAWGKGFEKEERVSASEKSVIASNGFVGNGAASNGYASNGYANNGASTNGTSPSVSEESTDARKLRKVDTSMDMFRNMAKKMR